jgi:hypothetical protein
VPGDSHDGLSTGFGGFRQLGDGVVPHIVRAQTFASCFLGQQSARITPTACGQANLSAEPRDRVLSPILSDISDTQK